MMRQRTIKTLVSTTGVGMHSGQRVELTLRPAAANTGIVFRRTDLDPPVDIPALAESILDRLGFETGKHLKLALASTTCTSTSPRPRSRFSTVRPDRSCS